jgi:6-phosphogluconolactonase/glucosamine-6-phosphate isomerase/deaminase
MNITTFTSAEAFLQSAYNIFLQSLSPTETNFIGLSGGSTPGPLYEKIGKESKKLPQNLEFFLLDERNVSLESSDSNFQLVQNTLFKNPETKELTNLHFFQTSLPREEVNAVYQQELEVLTKKPLNLAILGIGPDGHFASF